MAHTNSVTIRMGHLAGVAYWDTSRQTYAALLRLFDHADPYPPSWARYGLRTAEFLTPDALVNHLRTIGLEADDNTVLALHWLSRHVAETEGGTELIGLVEGSERRLYLVTPSGRLVALNPRLDHPDYAPCWGDAGPSTVETARLICEHTFTRRPAPDVETFALALTYEFLAEVEGDFSLDLNALCDWFLTDTELTTSLAPADLEPLRLRAGLASRTA